eukprot:Protomagalhaensia_sp_Gyna_25__2540@NODE_2435_length_1087_cov_6_146947_g2017_i0_p1_GENE_NODE_2435_length_1087_cov_6_146947_g2017_i0NODE_2435_length_1087_cov_6_146947_g2017_i0_p1_ORF_typecomplete_len308_score58_44Hydrolase_3/PF08282_12/4_8e40S6PP/PF05116_13/1_2e02S6PP/PF05116_13/0_0034Hydrolase/PF00702_26/0_003HAD/PF12710_7/4_1e02HAD/PF12710_7/0_0038_NODE_2435_length_1087_cov_6_146947_g2017_i038925
MAERPTWVASDMDETFLALDHTVLPSTQQAYRNAKAAGIPIIPCTGRSLFGLQRVVQNKTPEFYPEMQLTPGVYLNGTCVYGETPDDIIYASTIPTAILKPFLEAYYTLKDLGKLDHCTVFLQHPKGSVCDFNSEFFAAHCDKWDEELPTVVAETSFLKVIEQDPNMPCSQLSIIGDIDQITELEIAISKDEPLKTALAAANIVVKRPIKPMLTALHSSEHKAKGLRKLSERFPNLPFNRLLTIGDGTNDIEMLKAAPWSIAMGQAADVVKAAAKSVSTHNSEGGWAKGITESVL